LSPTDGYLAFWNDQAGSLAAAHPEKTISIPAYMELLEPPARIRPAANLLCWFCPIDANYLYPLSHPCNRPHLDRLTSWVDAMAPGRTATFEYYGWKPPLTPLAGKMQADLRTYRDLGLAGVYGWCGFAFNLMGNDYRWARELYVLAHLLWDADANREALAAEWAAHVFGSAAEPVEAFYRFLERTMHAELAAGIYGNSRWIGLDTLHEGQRLLGAARHRAESPAAAQRIDRLEALLCEGCTAEIVRNKPDPLVF
jgi:hypothetical protein